MLLFEASVRVQYWNPALSTMLEHASRWGVLTNKPVVVFSVNDKTHNPGSLHPMDLAIDFDVLGNNTADLQALYQWLRVQLPAGFDVIFEGNHVHVECDAKRPSVLPTPAKPSA